MTRKPKPSPSQTLLQSTLQPTGEPGQFDVVIVKEQQKPPEPITTLELAYLQRKHGTTRLNLDRIRKVKACMAAGWNLPETVSLLPYGRTQIKKDWSALSKAAKK